MIVELAIEGSLIGSIDCRITIVGLPMVGVRVVESKIAKQRLWNCQPQDQDYASVDRGSMIVELVLTAVELAKATVRLRTVKLH